MPEGKAIEAGDRCAIFTAYVFLVRSFNLESEHKTICSLYASCIRSAAQTTQLFC
jgi:hypothetical protein